MSAIRQLFEEAQPIRPFWQGKVHSAPTDLSDRIDVIVPEFDSNLVWRGCRWQARDDHSLPAPGDTCLIALDNLHEPWVICWWPYVT